MVLRMEDVVPCKEARVPAVPVWARPVRPAPYEARMVSTAALRKAFAPVTLTTTWACAEAANAMAARPLRMSLDFIGN